MFCAEYIAQISRDTGEPAAVTGHYEEQENLEQQNILNIAPICDAKE